MKKKIYWCIQQLDRIGGTEQVSINLMNLLCKEYDITLVCVSEQEQNTVYNIDPKIRIVNLHAPSKIARFDQYTRSYLRSFKFISFFKLVNQLLNFYIFSRNKYRKQLGNLLKNDEDALMIVSSLDNYWLAPKNGKVFMHYHFDAKHFLSLSNRFTLCLCRKPDKYIFLSEAILNEVKSKNKKNASKMIYIPNPSRFERILDLNYHDNTLIFAGRYSQQKNPLLALKVAKELKKRNFPFHLKMFGSGNLETKMRKFIKKNNLSSEVSINKPTTNIKEEILNSDMLLLTSRYEGFVLVKGEANSLSRPVIMSNWGPTANSITKKGEDGYVLTLNNPQDYADVIISILSSQDKLTYMKKKSYENSQVLEGNNIARIWKEII